MALMKLAAGLAVGYVLGTRAGRERFEQLAGSARELSNRPSVQEAKDKATRAMRGATSATRGRHASTAETISGDGPGATVISPAPGPTPPPQ